MASDQEFLLYPLDTGEDPACLGCGTIMMVAGKKSGRPSQTSSPSAATAVGGPKSTSAMNESTAGLPGYAGLFLDYSVRWRCRRLPSLLSK
jgi:hypothetical protein